MFLPSVGGWPASARAEVMVSGRRSVLCSLLAHQPPFLVPCDREGWLQVLVIAALCSLAVLH